jgi:Ni,Fe-hydrogenase maturation factor
LLLTGRVVPAMTVLGVEPESLEYGMNLSPCVQQALPKVVSLVRETIAGWKQADCALAADCRTAA